MEGWELQKENIQPLCSGRNVSVLEHSIDTSKSMADHDADVQAVVGDLERKIRDYEGNDPIEPHLILIKYLENHCFQSIHWKKVLATKRMDCYKKFYHSPIYRNDKRYVEAIVKCLNEAIPDGIARLELLQTALNKGIGKEISQMYIVIAEIQESLGKESEARLTLKAGQESNAQPSDKLENALLELEYRIARELAKSMVAGAQGSGIDNRNFGSSVPVYGEKNDAPVFRNDLPPAKPVVEGSRFFRMRSQPEKVVKIFANNGENEFPCPDSGNGNNFGFEAVQQKLDPTGEKENNLLPSKWNKPDVVVVPEVVSFQPSRERFSIFRDEIIEIKPEARVVTNQGVLRDRTAAVVQEEQFSPPGEELQTQGSSRLQQNNSNAVPMPLTNAKLMCCRDVLRSGNPASFEHRHRDAWLKTNKEKETVVQLLKDKMALEAKVSQMEKRIEHLTEVEESLRENFEFELKQKATKESQWERQKYQYSEHITKLTAELSQCREEWKEETCKLKNTIAELENMVKEYKDLQTQNSDEIHQLKLQIEQLKSSSNSDSGTLVRNSSNLNSTSSVQPSSSSNSNDYTFNPRSQEPVVSMSHSQSVHLATDKLMNSTQMSFMGSFVAPPSRVVEVEKNDLTSTEEASFNASVRMGGTSTVFGWRDENKTRFCFNDDEEEEMLEKNDDKIETVSSEKLMPPPLGRKLPFILYESMTAAPKTTSINSEIRQPADKGHGRVSDFMAMAEKVAPLPPPIPISSAAAPVAVARISTTTPGNGKRIAARVAEFEALGSGTTTRENAKVSPKEDINNIGSSSSSTIGQTFARPAVLPPTQQQRWAQYDDDISNNPKGVAYEPHQPPELPFDTSNLTNALQFAPPPLFNSTPQRSSKAGVGLRGEEYERMTSGNYIHTQRLPRFSEYQDYLFPPLTRRQFNGEDSFSLGEVEGPMSPGAQAAVAGVHVDDWRPGVNRRQPPSMYENSNNNPQTLPIGGNAKESFQIASDLSPIQETSKERSDYTTSSSSGNMTSTTRGGGTISGFSLNSNSKSLSSAAGARSIGKSASTSRLVMRFPNF